MAKKKGTYVELLKRLIKGEVPIQSVWAVVKSVDWDEKTMVAKGSTDDLEYYDILLGTGSVYYKPVVNSKVLIGLIDNNSANAFLVSSVAFEELIIVDNAGFEFNIKDGKLTMNGDQFSGIVKAPELRKQVDKNSAILDAMINVFGVTVTEPGMGAPSALQASLKAATAGKTTADLSNIENEVIKHG